MLRNLRSLRRFENSNEPTTYDALGAEVINRALEAQIDSRRILKNKWQRERHAIRMETDPDYREYRRKWQYDRYHKDATGKLANQRRAYHKLDTAARLTRGARNRAKRKGIAFDITVGYVRQLWPSDGRCPVLGYRMVLDRDLDESPSLDRIDPEQGYVMGNVRIISFRANRLKADAHAFELDRIAAYMRSPDPLTFVYDGEDRP